VGHHRWPGMGAWAPGTEDSPVLALQRIAKKIPSRREGRQLQRPTRLYRTQHHGAQLLPVGPVVGLQGIGAMPTTNAGRRAAACRANNAPTVDVAGVPIRG
jgi:hypothetical protein